MANYCVDVGDMDDVEFENIRDKVFEVLDEMEVDFEEIMNEDSSDKNSST